ncbi:type II toxin-antitoxin system RelE/ParE family toxin [Candidatus Gribaldobacteria bacterium]|nr:type II toxin-antitoxin system RelE/ParE family toxin [Candidatus Gribaldobacteria bacterium]
MYRVELRKKAEKELSKIPLIIQRRVSMALVYLSQDPFIGEPLKGNLKGFFSLHIHPYRIIYSVLKEQVLVIIIRIRHRKDAYK